MQACRSRGCHGLLALPDFGRSVHPISTRGEDYTHLITTWPFKFSDHPSALKSETSLGQKIPARHSFTTSFATATDTRSALPVRPLKTVKVDLL